jgi:hypothetical protein
MFPIQGKERKGREIDFPPESQKKNEQKNKKGEHNVPESFQSFFSNREENKEKKEIRNEKESHFSAKEQPYQKSKCKVIFTLRLNGQEQGIDQQKGDQSFQKGKESRIKRDVIKEDKKEKEERSQHYETDSWHQGVK